MKLLFDSNPSHRLLEALDALYPGSTHVKFSGLERTSDEAVWKYARDNGFTIVSKDSDLHQRSVIYGAPPKVVWVRLGNCSTAEIESVLRARRSSILQFAEDGTHAFLILSRLG